MAGKRGDKHDACNNNGICNGSCPWDSMVLTPEQIIKLKEKCGEERVVTEIIEKLNQEQKVLNAVREILDKSHIGISEASVYVPEYKTTIEVIRKNGHWVKKRQ